MPGSSPKSVRSQASASPAAAGSPPTAPAVAGSSTAPATAGTPDIPGATEHIEAEEVVGNEGDLDSTLGEDDRESSTASITSSILQYRTIHGRTYHAERGNANYWGSNDEAQSEAMDIMHHMFTLSRNGQLTLTPLKKNIQKALDVGCGTGIWAIDFADEYPECEVIGTDLSPIQPSWVPPNLKFEIEDCTQPWTFPEDEFDYIHMSYLIGCIPDWTALFKEAYRSLKPGGWLESFDTTPRVQSDDGTVTPESAMGRWADLFIKSSEQTGNTFLIVEQGIQRSAMEEAGFVDIQEWEFKCPLSPWPKDPKLKEIGQFGEMFCCQDTEGFLLFATTTLGWSREETHVFIAQFRREIRNLRHHPYLRLKAVWGRKPE